MNITNDLNLPQPLVTAIANDDYVKGDCEFSTTELISPPRITQLRRRHQGEIGEDASDRIFSLFGRAIHSILEHSSGDAYIVEKRYFMKYAGVRVGGQIDLFDWQTKTLQDWKITSYHAVSGEIKPEWVQQMNINALILKSNQIPVEKLEIVAIFRDWSKMMAFRRSDYPERQVQVIKIPFWSQLEAEQFLESRLRIHQAARDSEKTHLPLCTPEERWRKSDKWALMKKGAKKAIKLYETSEQAEAAELNANPDRRPGAYYVEGRPGEDTRCLFYCPVARFCDYGKELLMEKIA